MTEPHDTGSFCSPKCRKAYAGDMRFGISGPTTTEAGRCIYCGKSVEPDDTGCAICGAKPARDVPFTDSVLMRVCADHAGSDMLFARPTRDELTGMIVLDERHGSFVAIKREPDHAVARPLGKIVPDLSLAPPHWSSTPPTKPGWYWRRFDGDAPDVVRILTLLQLRNMTTAIAWKEDEIRAQEQDPNELYALWGRSEADVVRRCGGLWFSEPIAEPPA